VFGRLEPVKKGRGLVGHGDCSIGGGHKRRTREKRSSVCGHVNSPTKDGEGTGRRVFDPIGVHAHLKEFHWEGRQTAQRGGKRDAST